MPLKRSPSFLSDGRLNPLFAETFDGAREKGVDAMATAFNQFLKQQGWSGDQVCVVVRSHDSGQFYWDFPDDNGRIIIGGNVVTVALNNQRLSFNLDYPEKFLALKHCLRYSHIFFLAEGSEQTQAYEIDLKRFRDKVLGNKNSQSILGRLHKLFSPHIAACHQVLEARHTKLPALFVSSREITINNAPGDILRLPEFPEAYLFILMRQLGKNDCVKELMLTDYIEECNTQLSEITSAITSRLWREILLSRCSNTLTSTVISASKQAQVDTLFVSFSGKENFVANRDNLVELISNNSHLKSLNLTLLEMNELEQEETRDLQEVLTRLLDICLSRSNMLQKLVVVSPHVHKVNLYKHPKLERMEKMSVVKSGIVFHIRPDEEMSDQHVISYLASRFQQQSFSAADEMRRQEQIIAFNQDVINLFPVAEMYADAIEEDEALCFTLVDSGMQFIFYQHEVDRIQYNRSNSTVSTFLYDQNRPIDFKDFLSACLLPIEGVCLLWHVDENRPPVRLLLHATDPDVVELCLLTKLADNGQEKLLAQLRSHFPMADIMEGVGDQAKRLYRASSGVSLSEHHAGIHSPVAGRPTPGHNSASDTFIHSI